MYASCTTSDLGLELEASPSRYGDADPQNFGNRHPGTCHDKGRGGGDVQRAHAVAAGAHDIHRVFRCADRIAFGAHDGGGGGVFLDRLTAGPERHQEPAHLAWRCLSLEQSLEGGFGLDTGQGPFGGGADQRFQCVTHVGSSTESRKFCNSLCPCSDAMDSG